MDFDDITENAMLAAAALRPALEEHASAWRERMGCPAPEGHAVTTDLCRGAAYGLMLHLREACPDGEWHVDGGFGSESLSLALPDGTPRADLPKEIDTARWPGGMRDPDGAWRGHFWVRGRLDDGTELVVDLTADQFGYGVLVIEPATDPRYRPNVRRDLPDAGLTEHEKAWGEHLTWRYQDRWAIPMPGP